MINKIFCDGGSRGNPGSAACSFVAYSFDELVDKKGKYIGVTTNNVAEYSGVVLALEWLLIQEEKAEQINFYLDSQLIVNQLKGIFRINESRLREFAIKVKSLQKELGIKIIYIHIPREQNKEADLLVNETLDLRR